MTAALTSGRNLAESLMLDTCTITRTAPSSGIDQDTGMASPGAVVTVYAGKCKVQSRDLMVRNHDVGAHIYSVQRWSLHLPVSADGVKVGDTVEITASAMDAEQVGRRFRVDAIFRKALATAQRLSVEEVAG